MYSFHHGAIGASITNVSTSLLTDPLGLMVGLPLAFIVHDPTDRLGEGNYGSLKRTLILETVPFIALMITALAFDVFWISLLGYVLGNGIDLIDKKMYLSVLFPNKFKATKYFNCHRREPDIQLTTKQTKSLILVFYLVFVVTMLFTRYINV